MLASNYSLWGGREGGILATIVVGAGEDTISKRKWVGDHACYLHLVCGECIV